MTAWARGTLAIVFFLSAGTFVALAPLLGARSPSGPWPFYGLAAFCLVISAACVFQSSRKVTLRVIGAVIFCAYIVYVYDTLEEITVFRALRGFLIWGLPAGYLAIKGTYPRWGRAAAAFHLEGDRAASGPEPSPSGAPRGLER